MILKKTICSVALTMAVVAPFAFPPMHAGIIDLVCTTLARKIPAQPPAIRVLLTHDVPGVILEIKDKYKIYDPRTNEQVSKSFQGKRRFIQALADGLRWGEEFPGVHQIMIVPNDPTTTTIVDGIEYQGTIYVYDIGGSISVVNSINVEDYLNTILPLRYAAPLPEELLAAVAIAERTNCYYRMQNSKTGFWDVDAKKEGYHGYALSRKKAVEMAVFKTQYMTLQQAGEGVFALNWRQSHADKRYKGFTYSIITMSEAGTLAQKGKNAADILKVAFPEASLQLSYSPAKKYS